jgi:hypothetical protein
VSAGSTTMGVGQINKPKQHCRRTFLVVFRARLFVRDKSGALWRIDCTVGIIAGLRSRVLRRTKPSVEAAATASTCGLAGGGRAGVSATASATMTCWLQSTRSSTVPTSARLFASEPPIYAAAHKGFTSFSTTTRVAKQDPSSSKRTRPQERSRKTSTPGRKR